MYHIYIYQYNCLSRKVCVNITTETITYNVNTVYLYKGIYFQKF